jgi:chaperone modulatory protein CbpM
MANRVPIHVSGVILDRRTTFTLIEFSSACGVTQERVVEMVAEGVIDPLPGRDGLHFHGEALIRARRALRLVRDLGINWPGAALALDLLDELERMRSRGS